MKNEFEIHPIQAEILNALLFVSSARYSDLNLKEITSDHFNFHIKRLIELDLIEKLKDGKYALTQKGKEFANRFDTDNKVIERQAKIACGIICIKKEDGVTKYLLQKRQKQPFFGYYGTIGGKIKWGEKLEEGAARELKEETGYEADLKFVGFNHKTDYKDYEEGRKLLEDKYFFLFRGTNCRNELMEKFEGGENYWMTEEEILNIDKTYGSAKDLMDFIKRIEKEDSIFIQKDHLIEDY